ncbi:MAG: hypothetical protein M3546_05380 [Actinomycetota bacterium]|nr:hypothetical protein [Actinomycetota bacterium]
MRSGRTWVAIGAVAVAATVAIVAVALVFGDDESSTSKGEYQTVVANTRDRVDFALGRLSKAQTLEELLDRMDEAAETIDDSAGDLGGVAPPTELESPHERLVAELGQLAADVQGTADQARVPGFEDILNGAAGLNFESWDKINAILAELRRQGIEVEPLARQST